METLKICTSVLSVSIMVNLIRFIVELYQHTGWKSQIYSRWAGTVKHLKQNHSSWILNLRSIQGKYIWTHIVVSWCFREHKGRSSHKHKQWRITVHHSIVYQICTKITWKTSLFCLLSGKGNSILRSRRPGRRSAGSNVSARLVAIITLTFTVWSNPSICTEFWRNGKWISLGT